MANQAQVTSIESIEAFRASLIVFASKARRALDDAGEEVRRMRNWLQHDQRSLWETEVRRRMKTLAQAESDLVNARMNRNSETALMVRQVAVAKAKHAVTEAEDKVRMIKKWAQNFDSQVDPHARRLEALSQFISQDVPKGVAHLANTVRLLNDYAESSRPISNPTAVPAETSPDAAAGTPTETPAP